MVTRSREYGSGGSESGNCRLGKGLEGDIYGVWKGSQIDDILSLTVWARQLSI